MKIIVTSGDILDVPADVLVCSANIYLRLTGGVGGALRLKFGGAVADRIQQELDAYIRGRLTAFVEPGSVFETSGEGTPFQKIIHVVAVDGLYHAAPEIVHKGVAAALQMSQRSHVALAALGTGYGDMKHRAFGKAIAHILSQPKGMVNKITLCVRHSDHADEIYQELRDAGVNAELES